MQNGDSKGAISKSHALPKAANGHGSGGQKSFAATADGAKPLTAVGADCRALLVGINDYQGTVNDLPSCVNDVNAMAALLRSEFGFTNIASLTDAEATIANVTGAIETLFDGATADSRLVFFYSGHGSFERRGSIAEECLVLYDGMLFDDALSTASQTVAAGCLTVILDSCFSGGMEKRLFESIVGERSGVEAAKLKYYTHLDAPSAKSALSIEAEGAPVKRFGGRVVEHFAWQRQQSVSGFPSKAPVLAPPSDEVAQRQLNGLLLAACLETETAAASTSITKGLSAYTYGLTEVVAAAAPGLSAAAATERTQMRLRAEHFPQTPLMKEPIRPAGMGSRSLILIDQASKVAAMLPDQRALAAARSATFDNWRNNEGIEPVVQDFRASFYDGDAEQQKFWGVIAALAGQVVPRVIPVIVRSLSKGAASEGADVQSMPAEQQDKWLGALISIASVVVPEVVRALSKDGTAAMPKGSGPLSLETLGKGFWSDFGRAVSAALPVVINAISKSNVKGIGAVDPAMAMGKGFWEDVGREVVRVLPDVIRAITKGVDQAYAEDKSIWPNGIRGVWPNGHSDTDVYWTPRIPVSLGQVVRTALH